MVAFAFALALTVQAAPYPDGGPISVRTPSPNNVPENRTPPAPRVHPTPAPRPNSGSAGQTAPVPRPRPTPAPRSNSSPPPDLAANEAISADGEPSSADSASAEDKRMPLITVHSAEDSVRRGETGSFVLEMKPALMLAGMYVKFSVSGTAVAGVDYVALVSPAYIGHSGYGVIQIKTLPDRRSSSRSQAYSVVITLEDAAGYSVGIPGSATMWIKP